MKANREIEVFIEFPIQFEKTTGFVSLSGEESLVSFLRNDEAMIELLMSSAHSLESTITDLADETKEAYEASLLSQELCSRPHTLTLTTFQKTLEDASISELNLNVMLKIVAAALRILSKEYGQRTRMVFWELEP